MPVLFFQGFVSLFTDEVALKFKDLIGEFFGVPDVPEFDLLAVIRVKDEVGVAEDVGADGGADFDVLDLSKGDLDPSVGREKSVDLAVETVAGDEDQSADAGDECGGKTDEGDGPEAECQKADGSSDPAGHVAEVIKGSHTAADDQVGKDRDQRRTQIEEDRVILPVLFFNGFKSHSHLSPLVRFCSNGIRE